MNNLKKVFLLILFYSSIGGIAQTIVQGKVMDSGTNLPVIGASIISLGDNYGILNYTYSNDNGLFSIPRSENFILKISALGYSEKIIHIGTEQDFVFEIRIDPQAFDLDEVIIRAERPIKVKKDTIIFNAKAFAQGNEQVLEDLLKKIPGLTIDAEGTIKVGNQEVEKVMIEGDDFFDRGYKLLTRNMPAHSIDKVEVYQNYSNNRLLKGVEESEKVAINLTLNEDAKRLWFENLELGYGLLSKNRYDIRGNLMNFGKKNKY